MSSLIFAQAEKDWFRLLGLSFNEKEVVEAFDVYGPKTSSLPRYDARVQINWEKEGIAVSMDDFGRILSIYFMNDRYTIDHIVFTSFSGTLPFKVELDMMPSDIIELLGKPNIDEGTVYRRILYKTNYEYEFLFKDNTIQYFRIGLLGNRVKD